MRSIDLTNGSMMSVERLSDFVASSVRAASACDMPFHHIMLDRIFPDEIYQQMLAAMPVASDYRPMSGRSQGHDLVDGTPTRVKIDLFPEYIRFLESQKRAIWDMIGRTLCSRTVKRAFVERLAPGLRQRFGASFSQVGMYPVPVLTRDVPGYRIHPHPDTRWKGITVQLYLPGDASLSHVGTIFHERLADGSLPIRECRFCRTPATPSPLAAKRGTPPIRSGQRSKRATRSYSPISSMPACCGCCAIVASGWAIFLVTKLKLRQASSGAGRCGTRQA